MQYLLERFAVPVRRPQFELGVAACLQPDDVLVALGDDVERGDDLGVAPIEAFGQAQHGGQRPHRAAQASLQQAVALV